MNRREWIPLAAAGMLSGVAGFRGGRWDYDRPHGLADIFSVTGESDLAARIHEGIRASGVRVSGRRALIKADFANNPVRPEIVLAIRDVLGQMNAGSVQVADATLGAEVPGLPDPLIDLTGDDVRKVGSFYLPVTAAEAGLVISVAKAGSQSPAIANLAGILPPSIYGRVEQSSPAIAAAFSNKLAVIDGLDRGVLIIGRDFAAVDAASAQLA